MPNKIIPIRNMIFIENLRPGKKIDGKRKIQRIRIPKTIANRIGEIGELSNLRILIPIKSPSKMLNIDKNDAKSIPGNKNLIFFTRSFNLFPYLFFIKPLPFPNIIINLFRT